MADDSGERTMRATKRRRREARLDGLVARSRELAVALQLIVAAGLLFLLGRSLVESLAGMLASQLRSAAGSDSQSSLTSSSVASEAGHYAAWSSSHVLPWLLLLFVAAVVAGLMQTGFLFLPKRLAPNIARLSPLGGLRRLFSGENAAAAGLSVLRLCGLLIAGGLFLSSQLTVIVSLVQLPPGQAALMTGGLVASLSLILAACCVIFGAADYGYRRWKYERDLMMTPEEFRRELRDSEGDPQIRNARRTSGRERAGVDATASVPVAETTTANAR